MILSKIIKIILSKIIKIILSKIIQILFKKFPNIFQYSNYFILFYLNIFAFFIAIWCQDNAARYSRCLKYLYLQCHHCHHCLHFPSLSSLPIIVINVCQCKSMQKAELWALRACLHCWPLITYFFILVIFGRQHVYLTPQKCFLGAYSTKCPLSVPWHLGARTR